MQRSFSARPLPGLSRRGFFRAFLSGAAALAQSPAQQASKLVDIGVELSNRGRFHEAADKFVQALALDPDLAEAH